MSYIIVKKGIDGNIARPGNVVACIQGWNLHKVLHRLQNMIDSVSGMHSWAVYAADDIKNIDLMPATVEVDMLGKTCYCRTQLDPTFPDYCIAQEFVDAHTDHTCNDNTWHERFTELLTAITVATDGKQMLFEEDNGTWYSRYDGTYLPANKVVKYVMEVCLQKL